MTAGVDRIRDPLDTLEDVAWLARALLTGREPEPEAVAPAYYTYPPVKAAPWPLYIPVYFFLGGLAAGAALLALLADLFGGAAGRGTVRWGRYLAVLGIGLSPVLLILDLGRPERFHHMLRIFKVRSAMSVGTWGGITAFSAFAALLAGRQAAEDGVLPRAWGSTRLLLRLPARALAVAGAPLAVLLGTYTGVLLSATATPLWARSRLWLAPLFLSSALSSAGAAISLCLVLFSRRRPPAAALEQLERAERLFLAAELGLSLAQLLALGPLRRPLTTGPLGRIYRAGALGLGMAYPLGLDLSHRETKTRHVLARSAATLVGGFLLRYALVEAGKRSAADPQATFRWTARREE